MERGRSDDDNNNDDDNDDDNDSNDEEVDDDVKIRRSYLSCRKWKDGGGGGL